MKRILIEIWEYQEDEQLEEFIDLPKNQNKKQDIELMNHLRDAVNEFYRK